MIKISSIVSSKKHFIFIANVIFSLIVFSLIALYVYREKTAQFNKKKNSFSQYTQTLAQISCKYMEDSEKILSQWKVFLSNKYYSFDEVYDYLRVLSSNNKFSCHLIWADTLSGYSTTPSVLNKENFSITYRNLGYDYLFENCLDSDEIYVTSRYINPINGEAVLAAYTKIVLMDNNSLRDAIIVRIIAEDIVKGDWSFSSEYGKDVTVSVIDSNGNYIIKPPSMHNDCFFNFLYYYNVGQINFDDLRIEIFNNDSGYFHAVNSKGQECYWAFSHMNNNDRWILISSVPLKNLSNCRIDWGIPFVLFSSMVILILLDTLVYDGIKQNEENANRNLIERNSIIATLAYDFTSLFIIDPEFDEYELYRTDGQFSINSGLEIPFEGTYSEMISHYIDNYVDYSDRLNIMTFTSLSYLRKNITAGTFRDVNFKRTINGCSDHFQISVSCISEKGKKIKYVMGFRNINDIVKKEMEQERILREALKIAEDANKSKTVFLNNMSHDIRTPMNAIIGYTSLAQKHIGEKKVAQDYLSKITTSSNHLLSLINDILDMSRIESGKVTIEEKEIYLPDIFADLQVILRTDFVSKKIKFNIDYSGIQNPYIWGDKLRLNQVFLNLLSNAFKYTMPGGKVSLTVKQKKECEAGYGHYEFIVKDNGIGMSPEFLSHIYEPFVREKSSTVSGIQGTGLGLCITKNIVEMMGGSISVVSEEGKGSEFSVSVIFKTVDSNLPEGNSENQDFLNFNFKGKTILLVEDNELNQEIAKEILQEFGFKIIVVDDGDVAVEFMRNIKKKQIDLIMMDIQMPRMDGYTATREIRTLENTLAANVPIVAMTANAFEEDRKKAFESGMNGHIPKPFDIKHMLTVINGILN